MNTKYILASKHFLVFSSQLDRSLLIKHLLNSLAYFVMFLGMKTCSMVANGVARDSSFGKDKAKSSPEEWISNPSVPSIKSK